MLIAAVILLLASGSTTKATGTVDLVEINHKINPDGKEEFVQVIAKEWLPRYRTHRSQDWRLIRSFWVSGKTVTVVYETGVHETIHFKEFRETHTAYDPERRDQWFFDEKHRVKVFRN